MSHIHGHFSHVRHRTGSYGSNRYYDCPAHGFRRGRCCLRKHSMGMDIPWWNGHLAMVVSLCISTVLGGLTVYLKMKKIDVILSTLLRRNGTRGDVFLDLMDGWVTNIRAVLTFDSPVSASLYTITLILLQIVPAFSGLCVSTTQAMWQKPQNLTVTDLRPLTMTAIGQLQISTNKQSRSTFLPWAAVSNQLCQSFQRHCCSQQVRQCLTGSVQGDA